MGMTERERKAKVRDLQVAYKNAHDEVARLCKIGTDAPRAKFILNEAEDAFHRREYDEVYRHIAEAVLTARGSTQTFISMFSVEIMDLLDGLRTDGIDVGVAWPRLSAAKMELERMAFGRAARLLVKTIESIVGVSPRFHDVLMELVMARYNLTLAESFGLDMSLAREKMDEAFLALREKDYDEARWLQWQTRKEVRRGIRGYDSVYQLYATARDAVEMGEMMGAEVADARVLLDRGAESMEATEFPEARAFFEGAMDLAINAGKDMVWDPD